MPPDQPATPPKLGEVPALLAIVGVFTAFSTLLYKLAVLALQVRRGWPDDLGGQVWFALTPPGIVASLLLGVGSIAILRGRVWGITFVRTYAVLALMLIWPGLYVRLLGVGAWITDQQAQAAVAPEEVRVPTSAEALAVPIFLSFALVLCVYPVLLLYHLRRPFTPGR